MENKELVNLIFTRIKEYGFKPYNITHPDGYFIFEGAKDSVTHFYLRGHGMWRKWRFGLWVHTEFMSEEYQAEMKQRIENKEMRYEDRPKVISLFAQHETWIDKFKPSRSALCIEMDAEDVKDYLEDHNKDYPLKRIESMLLMMCRHPFMCYQEYCGEFLGYYSERSFVWPFIKYEARDKYQKIRKFIKTLFYYPYTKLKCYFAAKDKCIKELVLYDFEKENPGWSTSYLHEVQTTFTKESTQEEECAWMNKWWHKDDYGEIGYYDYVIHVDSCRKEGSDDYYSYLIEKKENKSLNKVDWLTIILFLLFIVSGIILTVIAPNPVNAILSLFITLIWIMYLVERILSIRRRKHE